MSWLNDSLSSLKGQLSNFTKDVLSEDFMDDEDDDSQQVIVPKDRIKELESLCELQKFELEELKRSRAEVEERLHASDISSAHQIKLLKQQLQESQVSNGKKNDWDWKQDLPDQAQDINNHHTYPASGNLEVQNEQLSRRVEDLQRELGTLRDGHQEQIALLQDQHRQQLLALRSQNNHQDGVDPSGTVDANMENDDGLEKEKNSSAKWDKERSQLETEKAELISRVDLLQRQVQQLKSKDEEAKELQNNVSSLTEECTRLRGENEVYIKNLEELDVQHQAVVDQIMKKKKSLQDEIELTKAAHDELAVQLAENTNKKLDYESEIQKLKSELQSAQEISSTSLKSLEEQLETAALNSDNLESQVLASRKEESSLREQLQKLSEENKMMKSHKEEEEINANSSNVEIDRIQKQYLELQQSNTQFKSSLDTATEELNKLRLSEASVREILSSSNEKQKTSEAEVTSLKLEIDRLKAELAKLTDAKEEEKKSQHAKFLEDQKQQSAVDDKLSTLEEEKKKLEQNLKTSNQELQDAKTRTEIVESEMQAKVQELEMSKERISELQSQFKHADNEVTKLRKYKKEDHEQLKKMLTSHNIEVTGNMGKDVIKVGELVRDSLWQRDTLERHVSTLTQELREKKDQLQESETTRVDLERECEDLRDQLEEIQKGERPQPEGSSSRGLPTIEEESEGCAEGDGEDGASAKGGESSTSVKQKVKVNNDALHQERASQIEALQAQVNALSEARRNLETEVANMRSEREVLQGQLRESEGRTGNLLNLETEAASLRAERNALEVRLSSLTQQVDVESVTLKDERDTLEVQVSGLEHHIHRLQAELTLNRHERECIGQQLLAQYKVQEERDSTVKYLEGEIEALKEKLGENSPEGNALAEAHAREKKLSDELNSVRSQFIFKEDKIDELSQVVEEVGNVFGLGGLSANKIHVNILNTYKGMQSQLAEQKQKLENLEEALQKEKEQNQNTETLLQSECSLSESKDEEISLLKEKLEKCEMELFQLTEKEEEPSPDSDKESELLKLRQRVTDLETEKLETTLSLEQSSAELNNLKQEMSKLVEIIAGEKESAMYLQQERETLISRYEEKVKELGDKNLKVGEQLTKITEETQLKLEERESRISTLQNQLQELRKDNTSVESFLKENEKLVEEERLLKGENERLVRENSALRAEKEKLNNERLEVASAKDLVTHQYNSLQAERDQMIATVTQKHQESVTYHAEIQRLMQVLNQTAQSSAEEKASIMTQLSETKSSLQESQVQVANLREEVEGLMKIKEDLQKTAANDIIKKTEISGLRKEIESLQAKYNSLEQERDQLRVANAHFNTQYQDQSKELNNIKEKEGRLSVEVERLRQHLVTVEESYTAEAIKAEEREGTLRSTLSKMEEKLNNHSTFYSSASQRASVQVEALQEQLREISAKRDDAVLRLHAAEEAAEQHQHSLATLQQVLQDFQKGQAREISEATERTWRQLEEEQEKNKATATQVENLKAQLSEVQSALAAASRLGEQLDRKEQMIITLKAQVTSQEEVARKARDEVVCLRTSSEGKIEKNLLRNLLVGYFATPVDKRQEVLRVIAEVLDFSGEERSRTGIDIQGKSWLSSIANFLAPPASNVQVTSKVDVLDHSSLSQAFIRFLEDESTPRPQARLPAVQMAQKTEEKAEKKAQAKAQAANKINPFVSTGEASSLATNTDSRSSPLLAVASAPPTLPTLAPTAPSLAVESNPTTPITVVSPSGIMSPVSTNKYLTTLLGSEGSVKEESK